MPILHKFQNHDWKNSFWTENSILKTDHYKPEVLFIGTFNHGWKCNPSDFFMDEECLCGQLWLTYLCIMKIT